MLTRHDSISLHDLGKKHGTDKWDHSHEFQGESYLHIYERYLAPMRHLPVRLLELGVRGGNSLRMWKEYFPVGKIFGVDFNPECKAHEEDRIHITIASQDDRSALATLGKTSGGFDIVVDDASHINHLTLASFDILFPFLNGAGIYIFEDLGMSWVDYRRHVNEPEFMEGVLKVHQEMGIAIDHKREDLDNFFRSKLFDMDMNRGEIEFIHFWSKLAIMAKVKTPAGS